MEESYWEQMKSGVADMVNTGGRQGGSITAALFLKQVSYSCHPAKKTDETHSFNCLLKF